MKRTLFLLLTLALLCPVASAQAAPAVTTDNSVCGRFTANVVDVPAGARVRFQLGHDLVKFADVTEQDTAARFDSGAFPASDWGFSVRVNDQVIYDQIVTVKPCLTGTDQLPFTGPRQTLLLVLAVVILLGAGVVLIILSRPIKRT